jgi:phage-related protein
MSDGSLDDRLIEIECDFVTYALGELRALTRRLAGWLYSKQNVKIVFDDEPSLYYMGKVANQVDLEQVATVGTFKLQLRCEPFVYYKNYAASTAADHDIPLFAVAADSDTYTYNVGTSPTNVTVNNFGHVENPFTAVISGGPFTTLTLQTADGKSLTYNEAKANGETITIDMDKMTADKAGVNKLPKLTGDFLRLPVGYSTVTVSGTGLVSGTPVNIYFKIRPRFI